MDFKKELDVALCGANEASKIIMSYYKTSYNIEIKEDNSPVTNADKECDIFLRKYLKEKFPTYAFLTEESIDDKSRLNNDYVWIIDPVDGTKDFIAHDDEFTCNIALAYKHEVVLGIVAIPAKNTFYYALKDNGAYVIRDNKTTKIHVNEKINNLTCLKSVFHTAKNELELMEKYSDKITKVEAVGSSIKACYIAEGKAEISYRLTNGTKEWDTAAFQIIVEEAGGYVLKPNKERILYNRENVYNEGGYIIINNLNNFLL